MMNRTSIFPGWIHLIPLIVIGTIFVAFGKHVHVEEFMMVGILACSLVLHVRAPNGFSFFQDNYPWGHRLIWIFHSGMSLLLCARSDSMLGIILAGILAGSVMVLTWRLEPRADSCLPALQWGGLLLSVLILCISILSDRVAETPDSPRMGFGYSWATVLLPSWLVFSLRIVDSLNAVSKPLRQIPCMLLCVILFGVSLVHYSSTVSSWYRAGVEERSYAAFRHDDSSAIRYAENSVDRASRLYAEVIQRLSFHGLRPVLWGWNTALLGRMGEQAARSGDVLLLREAIVMNDRYGSGRLQLLSNSQMESFYEALRRKDSGQTQNYHLWVDLEYAPKQNRLLFMDRWGSVFTPEAGQFEFVWEPDRQNDGAIDLELHEEAFVVLYSDSSLSTSTPLPFVPSRVSSYSLGGSVVDLELFPNQQGGLVVSSKGEIASFGGIPEGFASWNELFFGSDVVVDVELDRSGIGYYLLDQFGAIHFNGTGVDRLPHRAPEVDASQVPYWPEEAMAIDLEVDALHRGLSIQTRTSEVYSLSPTPFRGTYRPAQLLPNQGVGMASLPDGSLVVLLSNGEWASLSP